MGIGFPEISLLARVVTIKASEMEIVVVLGKLLAPGLKQDAHYQSPMQLNVSYFFSFLRTFTSLTQLP